MNIINIQERIEETLSKLNREAGGEAECAIEVDELNRPYLRTVSWCGNPHESNNGMITVCEYEADRAAETLGLDTDMAYAWCTSDDGNPTLAEFETADERDTWLNQK